MAIKKYKPTTNGRRNMTSLDFSLRLLLINQKKLVTTDEEQCLVVTTWAALQFVTMVAVTNVNIV